MVEGGGDLKVFVAFGDEGGRVGVVLLQGQQSLYDGSAECGEITCDQEVPLGFGLLHRCGQGPKGACVGVMVGDKWVGWSGVVLVGTADEQDGKREGFQLCEDVLKKCRVLAGDA